MVATPDHSINRPAITTGTTLQAVVAGLVPAIRRLAQPVVGKDGRLVGVKPGFVRKCGGAIIARAGKMTSKLAEYEGTRRPCKPYSPSAIGFDDSCTMHSHGRCAILFCSKGVQCRVGLVVVVGRQLANLACSRALRHLAQP